MKTFLLGCLCGFVGTIIIVGLYAAIRVGGDKNE